MNRVLVHPFSLVALVAMTISLSGCFNNMSGLDSSTKKSSQSNSTLNDSGFASETGPIDVGAILIGAYRDSGAPADIGILIDLQKSLTAAIGAAALQSIVDTIDTNSAMQAREVRVHVPGYNIKAVTTLGSLAANNNKKLRNIMNLRPRLVRVDLTTSTLEVPATPALLQFANTNKTIVTYGGKIEGDFVHRMTAMVTFPGANGSYLPNATSPNWGDGYPAAAPQESTNSVRLLRVSTAIRDHFAKLMTAPQDASRFATAPDSVRNISQTYTNLGLAVHLKMNADGTVNTDPATLLPNIDAAIFVNINSAVTAGPESFPFCNSGYDDQDLTITYDGSGSTVEYDYTHPLACNCDAALTTCQIESVPRGIAPPPASIFVDTWPALPAANVNTKKKAALIAAQMAATTLPAPADLIPIGTVLTVNGFTITRDQ